MTSTQTDEFFMARAIKLAQKGHYTTHPNPRVGCVIVKNNRIVGEGFHLKAGEPHAERHALAMAGDQAKGATAYVTLEPCSHTGRTPPCADGLIQAQIARVVIAMKDPNPLVAGKGILALQAAGIDVTTPPLMEAQSRLLNQGFIKRMEKNRPFVRCKMGMSLDGKTAMKNGESQWITGSQARQDVQRLRAQSSAIMTGIGTALADNPTMNVRLSAQELRLPKGTLVRQPIKILLDSQLQLPLDAKLLDKQAELWIFCQINAEPSRQQALEAQGATIFPVPSTQDGLDLNHILQQLSRAGINDILLETGAILAGNALQQGMIDELIIYTAPILLGDDARGLCHLPHVQQLNDKLTWQYTDIRQIGQDLRMTLRPHKKLDSNS